MNLKFWKRTQPVTSGGIAKLPRPKELPERVGMYMVTHLKEDPDWVWSLKSVLSPREGTRHLHDIRIYNPRDAIEKQVEVKNFTTLDDHRELILYFGVFDREAGTVQIEKPSRAAA